MIKKMFHRYPVQLPPLYNAEKPPFYRYIVQKVPLSNARFQREKAVERSYEIFMRSLRVPFA